MPIKRHLYHPDWNRISSQIREQADWKCEGTPIHPNCEAVNGELHPDTGSKVVLTVAHMDQNPANNDPANLRALCQRCHLAWDRADNLKKRKRTLHARKYGRHSTQYRLMLQLPLF